MKLKLRDIAKGLSLTSMMFVFQACYGTNQDYSQDNIDVLIKGTVLSDTTNNPIKQIKVRLTDYDNGYETDEYTNENGEFSFYTSLSDSIKINFSDIDSTENGEYLSKDTILTNVHSSITLDISLENK